MDKTKIISLLIIVWENMKEAVTNEQQMIILLD